MGTPEGEITRLLHAWDTGDRTVEDRLFELVLPDLRKLAESMMRRERPEHSLQPTVLLSEAYCRLLTARERDWRNRSHFFAIAARAMRRLLIEHARGRPRGARIPIDGLQEFLRGRDEQLELAWPLTVCSTIWRLRTGINARSLEDRMGPFLREPLVFPRESSHAGFELGER